MSHQAECPALGFVAKDSCRLQVTSELRCACPSGWNLGHKQGFLLFHLKGEKTTTKQTQNNKQKTTKQKEKIKKSPREHPYIYALALITG